MFLTGGPQEPRWSIHNNNKSTENIHISNKEYSSENISQRRRADEHSTELWLYFIWGDMAHHTISYMYMVRYSRYIIVYRQWRIWDFEKGGPKFSLATSVHTKEGANQVFQFFSMQTKKFFGQRGPWPNPPPKYASACTVSNSRPHVSMKFRTNLATNRNEWKGELL